MSKIAGIPWQRALAEFIVIFAGITFSLLADDWRRSREDAQRERSALSEIVSDLLADSIALAPKLERVRAWDQTALWVQRSAGNTDLPADSVGLWIQPLFHIHSYQPVQSAYVGLRAAGDLDLVRNDQIRRLIVQYYEVRQPYMVQFNEFGVSAYNALLDATRELVLWTADASATSFWDPEAPGRIVLLKPWAEISRDPIFLSEATWLGTHGGVAAMRVSTALEENSDLRSAILDYVR